MNTNQLYEKEIVRRDNQGNVIWIEHPKASESMLTKTGATKAFTEKHAKKFLVQSIVEQFTGNVRRIYRKQGWINVVLRFKTEAEGVKLANKFKKLAKNPTVQLNVIFEKHEEV